MSQGITPDKANQWFLEGLMRTPLELAGAIDWGINDGVQSGCLNEPVLGDRLGDSRASVQRENAA